MGCIVLILSMTSFHEKNKIVALVLNLRSYIGCGLIPNFSLEVLLRASLEMFGSTLIIGSNFFATQLKLAIFIFLRLTQLC